MLTGFGTRATLISGAVPAAVTAAVTTPIIGLGGMKYLIAEAQLVYGSAGTSIDVYLQTSIDGGTTWIDIMQFNFTTASAKKMSKVDFQTALTAVTAPGDGALTANTILNGVLGDRVRLKYTIAGTYAASTLRVDLVAKA